MKVAVKAAPPKRNLRAHNKARRPIARGGSRVATRRRIGQKSVRTPIATGPDRQARADNSLQPKRAPKKTRRRVTPKPKRVATLEPKKNKKPAHKPEPTIDEKPDETPATKPEPEHTVDTDSKPDETPAVEPKPDTDTEVASISTEIYFDTGSSEVNDESRASLQDVVAWLQAHPKGRLLVEGHTDPTGSAAANRRLSRKRANAVRAFLMSEAGVKARRFVIRARGESRLRYSRNSPKNRRVFIKNR